MPERAKPGGNLVILDIKGLPVMDGLPNFLTDAQSAVGPALPVVLLSGLVHAGKPAITALQHGAGAHPGEKSTWRPASRASIRRLGGHGLRRRRKASRAWVKAGRVDGVCCNWNAWGASPPCWRSRPPTPTDAYIFPKAPSFHRRDRRHIWRKGAGPFVRPQGRGISAWRPSHNPRGRPSTGQWEGAAHGSGPKRADEQAGEQARQGS